MARGTQKAKEDNGTILMSVIYLECMKTSNLYMDGMIFSRASKNKSKFILK